MGDRLDVAPPPKRARTAGAFTTQDKLSPIGVTRVEAARSSLSHCAWCDTRIEKGAPRVVKRQFHAPGPFVRNNGASHGYNQGGMMDEYLHPQCAWQCTRVGRRAACTRCGASLPQGSWHFATVLSRASARCTASSTAKCWQCCGCLRAFVGAHRGLLEGWVSEGTQFDEGVAWIGGQTLFGTPCRRPEPSARDARASVRGAFAALAGAGPAVEARAQAQHRALQAHIRDALTADKARGGKMTAKKGEEKADKNL